MNKDKKFVICEAEEIHAKLIWEWRNEPSTRLMSLNTEYIPWENHKEWFIKALNKSNTHIYIGILEGKPIAMIRYDLSSNFEKSYEISILVKSKYQGLGLGKDLLKRSLNILFKIIPLNHHIIACVKKKNEKSKILFKKNGFEISSENDQFIYYSLKNNYEKKFKGNNEN
tara:strand:- start:10584 stop:11093 length:510 start_codon:yes stop_codon:yes gene_type:complete